MNFSLPGQELSEGQVIQAPFLDGPAEIKNIEERRGIPSVESVLQAAMDEGFAPKDDTVSRTNASCPVSEQVTEAEQVRQFTRDGQMGERLVAVVLHHPDETSKKYRLATEADREGVDFPS